MKIRFRPSTLSSDFLFFSMIIFMALVLLPIGFWYEVYRSELAKKYNQLPAEAKRIGSVLIDSMDYTAKYAQFLGGKIAKHPNDYAYISEMISGKDITQSHEQNMYTTTFDWVTPDKQLRVSSKTGVLATPYNMKDRDYLARTPLHPWTFQLSRPRVGGLSGEWVIPAGMGITAPNGRFLGSITLGFSVKGLTRRIGEIMGHSDVRYLVVTDDNQIVLDSQMTEPGPEHYSSSDLSPLQINPSEPQTLPTPITYNGVDFSHYRQVEQSPYNILVGYDTGMPQTLFNQLVLSRMAVFSLIALAAFLMLAAMRRRLVKPVTQLAEMADHIIDGKQTPPVDSKIKEVAVLAKHLQRISDYVQNEHRISQELVLQTKALERANAEAVAACEIAQRADRAKSEFLANMSHELRTPMNAVVGLTSILLSRQYPLGKEKEYLQVLQSSADHLMELINDLLDITKLEAGEVKIERIPFELLDIVQEVAGINAVLARQKNIELRINNRLGIAIPRLLGDPLRIRQVLVNLVGNAVKFTDKGSVTIELQGKLSEKPARLDVRLTVIDTGIGIARDKLDLIFNKFTQADNSITRTHGGTGLGLSISRMLMHSMHGRLTVESTPGHGSRFTMTLPLALAQESDIVVKDKMLLSPEMESMKQRHILLAEDNSGNILVATCLLATYGYSYDLARDGKEALAKLSQNNYDAVLMDVQMPEMDGLEVTRLLREREKAMGARRLPIIGMTAYALPEDKRRCLQAGMDDYIAKPFDHQQLVTVMQRLTESYAMPIDKRQIN